MDPRCRILLVSGSLRARSTNAAALRTAQSVSGDGVIASFFDGLGGLPHFNPDDEDGPLDASVVDLRARIHRADALLLSTPEYAGALPGSFKNLLDWTVGDDAPRSIQGKPTAWINASPRGAELAHASLRTVLGYVQADLVEEACVHVPVTRAQVGTDGTVTDPTSRHRIAAAVRALALHACGEGAEPGR